jgi:hypothetical protein
MKKIEEIISHDESKARQILADILVKTEVDWTSNISLEKISELGSEISEFACPELNLEISSEVAFDAPELLSEFCQVIGIVGDDEFAWICRVGDGIVEIDPYDLRDLQEITGTVFPSIAHYLIFQLEDI